MKKFIISTEALKPALTKLGLVVPSKPALPATGNIYCRVTPGQVELIATDTETTIFYRLICESQETFDFLLPFDFINKVVALNRHCPFEIESGRVVKIKGPNDIYEVKPNSKLDDFPKIDSLPKKNSVDINFDVLTTIGLAVITASTPAANEKLSHVLMDVKKESLTVASSDGAYMVFSKEFPIKCDSEESELLISQKVIKVLSGMEKAKVFYNTRSIGFESDFITVVASRSQHKYVKFRDVFPADWPGNLTIMRSNLLEALGKCSISSDQLHTTKIDLSDKSLVKLTADDEMVNINVSIPGEYTGTVPTTTVNAEKLLRLLSQIDQPEIVLSVHDAKKAIVINLKDDPSYKGMIMPIASSN